MKEIPESRSDIRNLIYKEVSELLNDEKTESEQIQIRENIKLLIEVLETT